MCCVDILDALTRDFFARKGNTIETETVELSEVQLRQDRPGYEPISSTLWRQREQFCARLIQAFWKKYVRDRKAAREKLEEEGPAKEAPSLISKDENPSTSILISEVDNLPAQEIPNNAMSRSSSMSSRVSDV
jgi:voltage-gated sodium channel type II alpha